MKNRNDSVPIKASSWYEAVETRKYFLVGAVSAMCLLILLAMSLRNPVDYDGYWHLKMGKDLIENGLNPYRDHYSFTYNDSQINNPPVLFQVGLYFLVEAFDEEYGFVAYKLLAFIFVFVAMIAWLRLIKAPVVVYGLVLPLLVVLLQTRSQVRPELISFGLSLIAINLYYRTNCNLSVRGLLPIAVLLFIWSNYHSSIVGYVVYFGLFIDIGLKLLRERKGISLWAKWCCWGAGLVVLGFANPSLSHSVFNAIYFDSEWKQMIHEFGSPLLIYQGNILIYVIAILSVVALLMAVRQRKYGYFVSGVVLFYAASTMSRMVAPAGIIILAMFAHVLRDAHLEKLVLQRSRVSRLAVVGLFGVFLLALMQSIITARKSMIDNRSLVNKFPSGLTDYMLAEDKSGEVFSIYNMGGYLVYKLAPQNKVYIDGRTGILYPIEHFKSYVRAMLDHQYFEAEINKYGIDHAVLPADSIYASHVKRTGKLALDYVGDKYALYSAKSPRFIHATKLWAEPYCWKSSDNDALISEWEVAEAGLPPSAAITPMLAVAVDYGSKSDPGYWLESIPVGAVVGDDVNRFLGYRAFENKQYKVALSFFNAIISPQIKDDLTAAIIHFRNKNYTASEQAIDMVVDRNLVIFEHRDYEIMAQILVGILEHQPSEVLDRGFMDRLFARAGGVSSDRRTVLDEMQPLCASG